MKLLRSLVSVGLTVLAVAVIAWTGVVTPRAVLGVFSSPGPAWAGLLLILVGAQLSVLRWYLLLQWQGWRVRFGDIWRISYISWFLGSFLPGAAGTDVVRAVYPVRDGADRKPATFSSIILDRLFGLAALLMLAFGLLVFHPQPGIPATLRLSVAVVLAVTLAAIFLAPFAGPRLYRMLLRLLRGIPRISRSIAELEKAIASRQIAWHREPWKLALCLLLGLMGHVMVVAALVVAAKGAGATLPLPDLALAAAVGILLNQIPLTPGGIGIGELGFAQLALLMAPSSSVAVYGSAMLAFRLLTWMSYVPGAVALWIFPTAEARA